MKVSVLQNPARGNWYVYRMEGGKRKRTSFKTKADAQAEAERIRLEIRDGGSAWLNLSPVDRQRLMLAYHESQKRGIDLLELARGAVVNGAKSDVPTLGKCVEEMIAAKEKGGCSKKYSANLGIILGQFARGREALSMANVGLADVEQFLDSKRIASRSTLRYRLSALFRYAVRREYRPDNPCERLEPMRTVREPPAILTPVQLDEAIAFLKSKRPRALPWFVLTTLCGLRPEEADHISKKEISFKEGWIKVESATSKVRQRRVVYPLPEAMAMLQSAAKKYRMPIPHIVRRRAIQRLRDHLGFKVWPRDITRHSACSYWLAMCHDMRHVAEMLGHSESTLKAHYKAIVVRAQAIKFWEIVAKWAKPPVKQNKKRAQLA